MGKNFFLFQINECVEEGRADELNYWTILKSEENIYLCLLELSRVS